MTPEQIPQEIIDLFNERAGKVHKPNSSAIQVLAEILTKYDDIRNQQLLLVLHKYLINADWA